jgi:alkylated DNA repair dioxygenase AlkB
MKQADLLDTDEGFPAGFHYEPEFLSVQQEKDLLEAIGSLPLQEAVYRDWKAKRRIVSYGGRYDFTHRELGEAPPIPEFLHPLREQIARWAGVMPSLIHHAVIAEYRPGTQLGWHRDVPNFERVMGVSLGGRARMRLRPYPPKRGARAALALQLEPRSAYSFTGPARWAWQHAISPTKELRYSITFRTLRSSEARA